jgi:hypothetical protein
MGVPGVRALVQAPMWRCGWRLHPFASNSIATACWPLYRHMHALMAQISQPEACNPFAGE